MQFNKEWTVAHWGVDDSEPIDFHHFEAKLIIISDDYFVYFTFDTRLYFVCGLWKKWVSLYLEFEDVSFDIWDNG